MDEVNIPLVRNAALNERMYGSLRGLNKAETAVKYGIKQVEIWRRSFSVRPPGSESLQDTYNRTVPFYKSVIEPKLKAGKNVLIVAHGNSLRALMMYSEALDDDEISNVNILTGWPRLNTMDNDLKIIRVKYL
jgi:2,3-bisphosphoglycerate-dependent phosphoglycerate mutase